MVDDHTLFRRGLIALLAQAEDLCVVGEVGDANEALRLAESLQPHVILLDNHLPGVSGIHAIPDLLRVCPSTVVLMLTVSEDENDLVAALKNGAQGYLLKTCESDIFLDAIHRAYAGESVLSEEMTHKLMTAMRSREHPELSKAGVTSSLSPRETDIVRCIAHSASNKEIARTLGISETTVKIHVRHVLQKLNLHSRVQIAVLANREGIT